MPRSHRTLVQWLVAVGYSRAMNLRAVVLVLLAATAPGCTPFRASNQPLARWDETYGYRVPRLPRRLRRPRHAGRA
jgi:hypothetical protein